MSRLANTLLAKIAEIHPTYVVRSTVGVSTVTVDVVTIQTPLLVIDGVVQAESATTITSATATTLTLALEAALTTIDATAEAAVLATGIPDI